MPIIETAAEAFILGVIDEAFGAPAAGLDAGIIASHRQKLAKCIAAAAVYVRDNALVTSGIPVQVDTSSGIGTTTQPGTLS